MQGNFAQWPHVGALPIGVPVPIRGANGLHLQPASAVEIATTVARSKKVMLVGRSIGDEGACCVGQAVSRNSELQSISLGLNGIGERGANALAAALAAHPCLEELWLGGNAVCDGGAGALADALETNTTLKRLALWGNGIHDDGVERLARSLHINTILVELDLNNPQLGLGVANVITERGVQSLRCALESNFSITKLPFDRPANMNPEWQGATAAIDAALTRNASLAHLSPQTRCLSALLPARQLLAWALVGRSSPLAPDLVEAVTNCCRSKPPPLPMVQQLAREAVLQRHVKELLGHGGGGAEPSRPKPQMKPLRCESTTVASVAGGRNPSGGGWGTDRSGATARQPTGGSVRAEAKSCLGGALAVCSTPLGRRVFGE